MQPLLTIWTHPEKTLKFILKTKTIGYSFFLLFLTALSLGMTICHDTVPMNTPFLYVLFILFITVIYVCILLVWILTASLSTWIGNVIGGVGGFKDVLLVTSVAYIPFALLIPLQLLYIFLYGYDLYWGGNMLHQFTTVLFEYSLLSKLLLVFLILYGTIIFLKGICTVHNFSTWRSYGMILLLTVMMLYAGIILFTRTIHFLVYYF